MGNMLNKIKSKIAKSGGAQSKIFYIKADTKKRIRFLTEMEEPIELLFHDSFEEGINTPCLKHFGKQCPHCGDQDMRHRELFGWAVYDYDDSEVKIILWAANNFSPLPQALDYYEEYGTIRDRDYLLKRSGSGLNTTYTLMPKAKKKFKKKVDTPNETEMMKIIGKANGVLEIDESKLSTGKDMEDNQDDFEDEDDDFEVEEDWNAVDEEKTMEEALAELKRKQLWKIGKLCKVKISKKWNSEKMAKKLCKNVKESKLQKAADHLNYEITLDDMPF